MTEGTKYHPLFEFLLFSGQGEKTMTFAEIEAVIGARLPPSARRREEWWSNSASGHSQARAWLRANYKAGSVNLAKQTITFRLDGWPDGYSTVKWPPVAKDDAAAGFEETGQKEYVDVEKSSALWHLGGQGDTVARRRLHASRPSTWTTQLDRQTPARHLCDHLDSLQRTDQAGGEVGDRRSV